MDYLLRTTTESEMEDILIAAGVAQESTDIEGEVNVFPTEFTPTQLTAIVS